MGNKSYGRVAQLGLGRNVTRQRTAVILSAKYHPIRQRPLGRKLIITHSVS
jgi:hypothetical protein